MQFQGEETLPGQPETLWPMLFEPEMIAATIPGCEDLRQVGEDVYEGQLELRYGPFSQTFEARFSVHDRVFPSRYRMELEAQGAGLGVTASTLVHLEPDGPDRTRMRYDSTAALGGALGAFGALGEPVARMLIAQGLADLRRHIEARADRL